MKIKAILATLISAVAINGATAGTWCPPAKDKCPVECSPDYPGSVSIGYDTDYIWMGVRFARDLVWSDVNYTFELPGVGLSTTIGAWHGTSLASGDAFGDQTNLYASVGLPEFMGFCSSVSYKHYFFPTNRTPNGPDNEGDSFGSFGLSVSRELMCGLTMVAGSEYFVGGTPAYSEPFNNPGPPTPGREYDELSAWYHHVGVNYTQCVTDCIKLDLSAGVAYSDGLWSGIGIGDFQGDSGWNHYYVRAGLPIAVGCRATLLPYIGYNGTPDAWEAGNTAVESNPGANQADVFHGGVSLKVSF